MNPTNNEDFHGRYVVFVHLSLLLTALIWGVTFVAIKYVINLTGPATVLIIRSILSALCFLIILLFTRKTFPKIDRQSWIRLTIIAAFGTAVNNTAMAIGQSYLTAALASLIVTSNPIFTAIISRFVLGEPLTRRKGVGILIAFCGFLIVLLLGGPNAQFSVQNAIGVLIMLFAPLGFAFYTVLSKPLLVHYEPHVVAALTAIIGAVIITPAMFFFPESVTDLANLDAIGWLAALMMSAGAIVVGYTLWYRGLRHLQPSQVAVYVYLVPFFGVVSAWLLLGDRITLWLILGGLTILAGVAITNTRGGIYRRRREL